jgi:hypothetical protein
MGLKWEKKIWMGCLNVEQSRELVLLPKELTKDGVDVERNEQMEGEEPE